MKKLILLILILTLFLYVSAATDSVSTTMYLDMNKMEHSVALGFIEASDIIPYSLDLSSYSLDKVGLEEELIDKDGILSKDIRVFWDISSPRNFKVLLTGSPLSDNSGNMLDFSVTWIPYEKDEEVSIGLDGDFSKQEIYTHHPELSLSHSGTADLRIETETLSTVIPGTYHGELTLVVEDE